MEWYLVLDTGHYKFIIIIIIMLKEFAMYFKYSTLPVVSGGVVKTRTS